MSTALAYALDIKDVRHVNVEFHTDAGETLPEPVLIGQAPHLADLGGKRVLVADDVADTGATLQFVRAMLPDDAIVHVAVLYEEPHTTYAPPRLAVDGPVDPVPLDPGATRARAGGRPLVGLTPQTERPRFFT